MNDDAAAEPGARTAALRWARRLPPLALVTYGLAQVVLLFWWAAYHPGLFSPDSLNYVWQSTTGHWNTHHPVSYTALVWLSLQLTGGLGALTLVHTAAMAVGLAYAVAGLRRLGGPAWLWCAAAVAVVALPPVGTFVLAVWKDVAYVVCQVFLLGTLARLVAHGRRGGAPPVPRPLLLALAAELTLLSLFRQNGFAVATLMIVLCAPLLRGVARRLAVAGVAAAAVALLANWLLLPALGVRDSDSIVALEAFLSDIAVAYAADPGGLPAADAAVLARVAPLPLWRDSANCASVDTTVYHPEFDRGAAAAHKRELLTVWWHAARRAPGTIAGARICRGAIAWRPTSTGGVSRNPTPWGARVYVARDAAFRQSRFRDAAADRPLSTRARAVADRLTAHTTEPEWLLWRGATWAYATYLVIGAAAWRHRDRTLLAVATLTAANQLCVLAVNNVQAARYMAGPFVLGILLLPLAAARRPTGPVPPAPPPAPHGAGRAVAVGAGDQARLDDRG